MNGRIKDDTAALFQHYGFIAMIFVPTVLPCDQHRLIQMIPCMPFVPLLLIGKVLSNLFKMNLSQRSKLAEITLSHESRKIGQCPNLFS